MSELFNAQSEQELIDCIYDKLEKAVKARGPQGHFSKGVMNHLFIAGCALWQDQQEQDTQYTIEELEKFFEDENFRQTVIHRIPDGKYKVYAVENYSLDNGMWHCLSCPMQTEHKEMILAAICAIKDQ